MINFLLRNECSLKRGAAVLLLMFGALLLGTASLYAQDNVITVEGTIIDQAGAPIAGATVVVKEDMAVGTTTSATGQFSIRTKKTNTVVISFIGYVSQEMTASVLNGRTLTLKEDSQQLDDVVVIAYGQQKKVTVTGAVTSLGSKELMATPVASLGNALAGKLTGVSSIQYSGAPGADDPDIFIRGVSTLSTGSSKPLILVDGVERSFTQIDPNEVADISILKDASATAVFGVRGANGVILVTTKRGTKGAARVSLTTSVGVQLPTSLLDFANSYDYATYYNESQRNDGIPEAEWKFKPDVLEAFRTHSNPVVYPDMDWLDYLLKPAALQSQHNVNVSGGTDRLKYFVSIGYLNQQGLFRTYESDKRNNFNYNRYNYRANIDVDVTKTTEISVNLGGRVEVRNMPRNGENDVFRYIQAATPFGGAGIVDGKWITVNPQYIPEPGRDGLDKIYGRGFKQSSKNVLNLDLALTQRLDMITEGLSLKVKGSYNSDYTHTKDRGASVPTYTPFLADNEQGYVLQKNGDESYLSYSESFGCARDWYAEASLNYSRKFGDHNVSALLLYNQLKKYYPDEYEDIPTGYVGLVGRITYDYRTRYMIDLNIGYNGSENFAPGKRYGFFPAVSVGWILTSEEFMKNQRVFTYLKIRGSYGVVGNDKISSDRFLYLPDSYEYKDTGYNFGTQSDGYYKKAVEMSLGNPNLTWEKAYKKNVGLDANFLNDRLSLNLDLYQELRKDILITPKTTPIIYGITPPNINYGRVDNRGLEVVLTWKDKIGKDFTYTISPNFSYNRNKILEQDEVKPSYPYLARTGRSVGQFFGYEFFGFYNGEETERLYEETYGQPFPTQLGDIQRGDCVYVDLNGNGKIDSDDIHPIGYSNTPRITAGLNLGFTYKGLNFSMLWTGVTQVSRKLDRLFRPVLTSQHNESMLQWSFDNRWTEETAATATLPRASFLNEAINTVDSRLWIVDASYIRLRNVEIGYTFQSAKLKKLGLSSLRIYATGYNLLTFTRDYPGGDPEQIRDDLDDMRYPVTKILNLGLSLTF